jgi:hypothetical protein
MTEEEAFKQLAVEALGGFGYTVNAEELPDFDSMMAPFNRIIPWWNGLDQFTRDLLNELDLSDGMWNEGWMYEWPGLYQLMNGSSFSRFNASLNDIFYALRNAKDRAPDYAAQHAVGRLEDDPALSGEQGN